MDFFELIVLFGVGFSTGLSGAIIPGPLTLYTVSEALRNGQLAGVKVALGHLLVDACFAVPVVVGLRGLLTVAAFKTAVIWIGSVGLIGMGVLLAVQLPRLSLAQRAHVSGSAAPGTDVLFRWGPVAGGIFFSLVSPGFIVWWATIGASVLLKAALAGLAGVAMLALGHALADLGWCWLVAFSVERGTAYCSDRTYRAIIGLIALGLVVLGIGLPLTEFWPG